MHSPLRFGRARRIHLTSSETRQGVRRYKVALFGALFRLQVMGLAAALGTMGIVSWLTGRLDGWPVVAGFFVMMSFFPWLRWNRRYVYDAGNGWYQIGIRPETLEKLRAFRPEAGGETSNSSA